MEMVIEMEMEMTLLSVVAVSCLCVLGDGVGHSLDPRKMLGFDGDVALKPVVL